MIRLACALTWLFALIAPLAAQQPPLGSDISVSSTIVANNTTAIVIATKKTTVYLVEAFNNSTTLAYIKLYNAASATCGQAAPAPFARYMIPFGASSSGGGFALPNINGDAYVNGVVMCVTTGIADSDTGTPAATTYIVNVHYKSIP
jgi:hypothetical protein